MGGPVRPGSVDAARDYMRRRVGLYFRVLFIIHAGIYAAVLGLVAILGQWQALTEPRRWVHVGVILGTLFAWQFTRRRDRSVRALAVVDMLGTLAVALGVGLFGFLMPADQLVDEDLELVLALSQILMARAVIVPSTAWRTLRLGFAGALPLTVALYFAGRTLASSTGVAITLSHFDPLIWLTVSVLLTGLTSRVIYGLRRRAEHFARLGQYTLGEKLGEGGMGVVYRASHSMLRRPTALKLLPPELTGARAIARFEREVQLTATLTHPNTVAIYDFGRTPEGVFYYVMEFLDGLDLEAVVRGDGSQPAGRVVHILKQVAGALAEAHGVGLIHRDIKPANILLCERGRSRDFAKVVDFGLVRDLSGSTMPVSLVGALEGTPLYMAPEAISTPDQVDGRADLYALGAVAYYLLTATPVFSAATLMGIYDHHLHTEPRPPSERSDRPVPRSLEALVLSLLEKRAELRPPSADDLIVALEGLDDVAPWTPADARSWWAGPGRAVRGELSPRDRFDPSRTVVVNLGDRHDGVAAM